MCQVAMQRIQADTLILYQFYEISWNFRLLFLSEGNVPTPDYNILITNIYNKHSYRNLFKWI